MIEAVRIEREAPDTRSSGDSRRRVDAYFVLFHCPADAVNPGPHEWIRRFEVPRGTKFEIRNFPDKQAAIAASGWKL